MLLPILSNRNLLPQISSAFVRMTSSQPLKMQTVIEQTLRREFQPTHMQVEDVSGGCGQSFQVVIVSNIFEGKSTLQRHRIVNSKLKDQISELHAFSQHCFTPEQWKQRSDDK